MSEKDPNLSAERLTQLIERLRAPAGPDPRFNTRQGIEEHYEEFVAAYHLGLKQLHFETFGPIAAHQKALAHFKSDVQRCSHLRYTMKLWYRFNDSIAWTILLRKRHLISKDADKARLQRLALAHIETQKEMEGWLAAQPALSVYAPAFLARLHESFYGRLPESDRTTKEGDRVNPGEWRKRDVDVGRHLAPAYKSIPRFMERAAEVYSATRGLSRKLIAIACAHHRLAWVHPFRDGNGRVVRLQSQAALLQHGAGSGLWAVSRGLARTVDTYCLRLAEADSPRRGDLDGRGNLSEEGLVAFARYFLETCLDQATFMAELLDLDRLRDRVRAFVVFLSETEKDVKLEVEPALYHVFLAGNVPRGEFKQMTGLGARTSDKVIAALLRRGLLESDTPKGPVRIGLPLDALSFYFPRLYPEAAA